MQHKTPKIYASLNYNKDRKSRTYYAQPTNSSLMLRPIISMILLCLGLFVIIFLLFFYGPNSNDNEQTKSNLGDQASNSTLKPLDNRIESWWNNEYGNFKKLNVQNLNISDSINSKDVVTLSFDHAKMVKEGKSTTSGKDLKMVYLTKDNKFREINFDIVNPNSDKTNLRFELIDTIGVKESNNYFYLYYGNVFLQDVFKLTSTAKPIDDKSFVVSIGEENKHPLNVDISRKWILKGGTTLDTKFKSSQVKVSTSDTKIMSTATLNIMDKNFKIVQSVNMLKDLGIESFTQSIDLSSLAVGDYAVQISATVDGAKENSPKQKIHISWPLYVNWSIDWEGDDVTDKSLQTVESIANENKVPITHYFNPRIYVGGMSSERSKFLTNWVLNRKAKNGDEIGLHLHMWYDMVKTIGITEKREPFWDDAKTGHDVPQTAYSAEEFDQMVSWALMQFNAHGLPVPNVYRAGGWQINIDQLKVLAKYRFLADSSGRDSIKFGKKQYQVPWSLYPTTKPYKPSIYDMNTPGVTNIGLWEFPNNGDNTSSYGPNSTKVIDNFKENYDGSALKEKQMFVILSHMQYFSNDEPVVRRFFAEVSKSLASSDSGPVIYSTIQSVIPEYENVVK